MFSSLRWRLNQVVRSIWAPVLGFGLLGVLNPLIAPLFSFLVPDEFAARFGEGAVEQVLEILATSMLAVTTFAVSIMVASFASAAQEATPRTLELLQSDPRTRYVLGIFVGDFIFAITGVIAINAGLLDDKAKAVLFVLTVLLILVMIGALMNWIAHLTKFGRMHDSLDRVESAAHDALELRLRENFMGGRRMTQEPSEDAHRVRADWVGYVRFVDMTALQQIAEDKDLTIHVLSPPGSFVTHASSVFAVTGDWNPDDDEALRSTLSVGHFRSFDQDPRFGLTALSEIGSRALSPGVNDPGTAIDVLGRFVRLLSLWTRTERQDIRFDRIMVPDISVGDMMEDGFAPIARDGSTVREVMLHHQQMLDALVETAPDIFARPAADLARRAATEAGRGLVLQEDRDRIARLAEDLEARAAKVRQEPTARSLI